eukprot:3753796-Rhodomonas_salina.4
MSNSWCHQQPRQSVNISVNRIHKVGLSTRYDPPTLGRVQADLDERDEEHAGDASAENGERMGSEEAAGEGDGQDDHDEDEVDLKRHRDDENYDASIRQP